MARYFNKLALLAKIEGPYGIDAGPSGAANAVQASECSYEVVHDIVFRRRPKPYMGHDGVLLAGKHVQLSFDVDIAGPGAEGVFPSWGPLLRMAGFAETFVDGDIVYRPRSKDFEAGSIYYNLDGVNHVCLGARGNVKLSLKAKEVPRFTFEFKGLLGTIQDTALPAVSHADFGVPVVVSKANTVLSLHGYAGGTESMSIDVGALIEPRLLINYEGIEYVGREATGEVVMDATTLGIKDWWSIARNHAIGALAVRHGTVAGNIIEIDAPAVQVGIPRYQASQKLATNALKLMLLPSTGNDELTITVAGAGEPGWASGPAWPGYHWEFVYKNGELMTVGGEPMMTQVRN